MGRSIDIWLRSLDDLLLVIIRRRSLLAAQLVASVP